MFAHTDTLGPVALAFTDRHGGVSRAPFDSLNLALEDGDEPASRQQNLARAVQALAPGARLAQMRQVHGAEVVEAGEDPTELPEADALVTTEPGVVLLVRVADCVPVLLADPGVPVVAAVHCGRPGLAAGIVPDAVRRLRALGAGTVTAWVGPHVCGSCYEVPAQLREDVGRKVPAAPATTAWGTPALDLGAGVRAQLEQAGVEQVHELGRCTRESPDQYSYRRDGERAGRSAGLVVIRS